MATDAQSLARAVLGTFLSGRWRSPRFGWMMAGAGAATLLIYSITGSPSQPSSL